LPCRQCHVWWIADMARRRKTSQIKFGLLEPAIVFSAHSLNITQSWQNPRLQKIILSNSYIHVAIYITLHLSHMSKMTKNIAISTSWIFIKLTKRAVATPKHYWGFSLYRDILHTTLLTNLKEANGRQISQKYKD